MRNPVFFLVVLGVALAACGSADKSPQTADAEKEHDASQAMHATRRGPVRAAQEPEPPVSEHPYEPRRAADEPTVFRSTTRAPVRRFARDASFQPGGATAAPVWYGLMHAHTLFSDGSGTPEQAFTQARQAGLDFLAVTSHNHDQAELGASGSRKDGVLIATNTDLYDSPNPQTVTRRFTINGGEQTEEITAESLITAATNATQSDFVGLFGQEFSSISSGNHVNVIGAPSVITIPNGNFAPLYSQLDNVSPSETRPIVQMNHPNVHKDLFYRGSQQKVIDRMFNDYGLDEFNRDFAALVNAADAHVVLVEVLTGPALDDEIHPTFHYPSRLVHDDDYYYYLIQGFHLSPSVGQDNHFETWGDATPARMGIVASDLTRDALLAAIRENRTFATEDPDLRVELFINDQPMGSVLTLSADDPLEIEVHVADASEPNSSYVAELFYGDVAPQDNNSLEKWVLEDGLTESFSFNGDGVLKFDEFVASGRAEFFLVSLQQGDGDRAWTAPVWINHPRN